MGFDIHDDEIRKYMFKGSFGLEKESLRVDENGYLSHIQHPFLGNPYIDRDFCENQIELITAPRSGINEAYRDLEIIHKETVKSLYTLETGKEILWPFSNPPFIKGNNDIPIAHFQGELKEKEYYREYLAKKYGKKKMLFSGIHVNYSFSLKLLQKGFQMSSFHNFQDYKNHIYLELAKKIVKYSWFIVYLTAASPILDGSFFDGERIGENVYHNLASARCSEIGYWNNFVPVFNYHDLNSYVQSIQNYVNLGQLKEPGELYYPVRLKPKGVNDIKNLEEKGVNHIELRMLDLNPFSPIYLMKEDIEWIHLLIIYLMSQDDLDFDEEDQICAIQNEKKAAKYDDQHINIGISKNKYMNIRKISLDLLNDMEKYFVFIDNQRYNNIIQYQKNKILNHQRYVERIKEEFSQEYVSLGIKKAIEYAEKICKGE